MFLSMILFPLCITHLSVVIGKTFVLFNKPWEELKFYLIVFLSSVILLIGYPMLIHIFQYFKNCLEINAKWFLGCFWSPTCKFKHERKLDFKSQIWNVILLRIKCLDQTAKINELFTELAFPLQLYSYSPLWEKF